MQLKPIFRFIRTHRRSPGKRRGAALVLIALMLPIIIGMVAFAVDVGLMSLLRSQIQNAVDSATLAASLKLRKDPTAIEEAQAVARQFVQLNRVGMNITVPEDTIEVEMIDNDTARFRGAQCVTVLVDLVEARPEQVELTASPGWNADVRVLDGDKRPLPAVEVRAWLTNRRGARIWNHSLVRDGQQWLRQLTGPDGRAGLPNLPNDYVEVFAFASRYRRLKMRIHPKLHSTAPIVLTLR